MPPTWKNRQQDGYLPNAHPNESCNSVLACNDHTFFCQACGRNVHGNHLELAADEFGELLEFHKACPVRERWTPTDSRTLTARLR